MNDPVHLRLTMAFLMLVVITQAVFAALPGLDLAVSGLFADGSTGFPWSHGPLSTVNLLLRRLGELTALALVVWCIFGGLTGRLRGDALKAWTFAACVIVIASGLIVSLLLKAHVGRARPATIIEFGGEAHFTPAWQISDQCVRNCSFTSGEVSLAASLAIVAVVLLWPRLNTAPRRVMALALASAYVGLIMLLRIGLGRHFLSDALFAVLFSGAVALALYPLLGVSKARLAFDPTVPVELALRQLRDTRAHARAWLNRLTW